MRLLLTDIKELVQIEEMPFKERVAGKEMSSLPSLENAWLLIDEGKIQDFGKMDQIPEMQVGHRISLAGKTVLPAWVDSHTHIVFAEPREREFVDKIKGLTYAEIAARGGGILNSAHKLRATPEEQLYDLALERLESVMALGTGAIEIKSGYGLNTESELKMLRVIRRLKENADIPIKASFLAAHAYPVEYKDNKSGYIDLIINEMLPKVADEGLADYMDAFCEEGFFSVKDTSRLLEAGLKYGLKPKIHANQLHRSGGVQVGVKYNAVSVDHLESMGQEEIDCLKDSNTIATLLPGAAFFLAMHYQPARALIDAGLPVCLASDYNPGSCPSGNMNFLLSLACTQLKMTPEEAINAQTLNGAAALELSGELGTIARGKTANLIITKPVSSIAYLPYSFGENWIDQVLINGK